MIGTFRMVQRNALVYRHVWRGSLFSSFLQPTLFLVAMGLGVGGLIDPAVAAFPGGASYLEFLAPGLMAAAAMQVSTFESTYPVLGKMKWHRNYEAITATPMRPADVVAGELTWLTIRLASVAGIFLIVMTGFGIPRSGVAILAVPSAMLTGLAFAAPIMGLAATRETTNAFNALYRFGITPLFLFSGVFFPVSRLPEPLQRAAWLSPLFHGVELTRGYTLELDVSLGEWAVHVAHLGTALLIGAVVAVRAFHRRLSG